MAIGHIEIRARPIKLAFLVRPSDVKAIRSAIQISTFLWGGTYNPIIPVYKHKPKHWEILSSPQLGARDIVIGYLEAFDPDFLVPLGECAHDNWDWSDRELIKFEQILPDLEYELAPSYGIGLFEILDYLYAKEFKFVRREPLDVIFPAVSYRDSLFLESFFGALPESIDDAISQVYGAVFPIGRPSVSIHQFHEYMSL